MSFSNIQTFTILVYIRNSPLSSSAQQDDPRTRFLRSISGPLAGLPLPAKMQNIFSYPHSRVLLRRSWGKDAGQGCRGALGTKLSSPCSVTGSLPDHGQCHKTLRHTTSCLPPSPVSQGTAVVSRLPVSTQPEPCTPTHPSN